MLKVIEATGLIRSGGEGPNAALYATIHHNDSGLELWDSEDGKLIAGPHEYLLKSGKYERGGLINRLKSYHRWRFVGGEQGAESTYVSSLCAAFIVSFDGVDIAGGGNGPQFFEAVWNDRMQRWANSRALLARDQNRRTEYRRLHSFSGADGDALERAVADTRDLIGRMIAAMAPSAHNRADG